MKEKVIIGVDVGGTKTKATAVNLKNEKIFEVVGPAGSPAVVGVSVTNILEALIKEVVDSINDNYEVIFIQVGMSGLGVLGDKRIYELELSKRLNIEVAIASDATMGLYRILEDDCDEAILVVAGTGSVVSGIKDDEVTLVGGYGVLLTEGGSSYATVKNLVVNIINTFEEDAIFTDLGKEFMEHVGVADLNGFRQFMYGNSKTKIASYAPFISKKASEGNLEAILLLSEAGRVLANWVRKLVKNKGFKTGVRIGFNGSFIEKAPYVKAELFKALDSFGIKTKEFTKDSDSVYGAYYMAKRRGII